MAELSARLANLSPAKRKLLEQRLQSKPTVGEPIAIIGLGCRFPGARDVASYWRLIRDGIDATGDIPSARFDVDSFYDPTGQQNGKMSVRCAGMIDDFDQFDSAFFGITPREAAKVDPQQRLLLEVAWESLENAGLAPDRLGGSATGVFVGIGGTDYSKVPIPTAAYYTQIDVHSGTGNALSIAANRISYLFDFHGPSIAVDTACSSGMVGVHLAAQSLRNRECDTALAGAVNMILSPETTIAFSKAHMLSPDGRCRPFDASANGYIRGEGCGLLVLKRLTDAVRDGDRVLAILRATATNQDGRTSGITAPNGRSQESVIRTAWNQAGIKPGQISYIEAHGTGTPLGDPIEMETLGRLFPSTQRERMPVFVTSVKANIGHTETASGVAGIIKVVLMMQHGLIPAQLHFSELNPHMTLDGTRLRIPREPQVWSTDGQPRIAGVSSFGFGGSNTHAILEESTPSTTVSDSPSRSHHLLTLSAKSDSALQAVANRYEEYLAENPDTSPLDFSHTLNTGRSHFNHRAAIIFQDCTELQQRLEELRSGSTPRGARRAQVNLSQSPRVAFLFTGQGSQYFGMGRTLLETEPTFREVMERCEEILREQLPQPLLSVIYSAEESQGTLNETAYTQPALFAIGYALATLWRSWGIEPSAVMGHSVGEYVAACVAGVFSLEAGLTLIAQRARLMQQLPRDGSMAVIFASADRVSDIIASYSGRVAIAAVNGPENTTISGHSDAVDAAIQQFHDADMATQSLAVSHAFHSPLMEPMLDEFEQLASQIDYQRPQIPLASNLTGQLCHDAPSGQYWREHIRHGVQFADGMARLSELQPNAFLEIGPTASLIGMGRRCISDLDAVWLPSLRKGKPDWPTMLGSLADLYVLGAKVNWPAVDRHQPARRLSLPTYPFQRTRHWYKESEARTLSRAQGGQVLHPLLQIRVPCAIEKSVFESTLSADSPAYLADHQVQGSAVTPAAAYVEQALAAAEQVFGPGAHAVENLTIHQAMFLPESTHRTVQVTVSAEAGGHCALEIFSQPADESSESNNWTMHANATLQHADQRLDTGECPVEPIDVLAFDGRVIAHSQRDEFYERIAKRGLVYGPCFQVLDGLRHSETEALAEIQLPESVQRDLEKYKLHPALGDALLQTAAGLVPLEQDGSYSPYTYMPTRVQRVKIHAPLTESLWTYAVRTSGDKGPSPETVEGNLFLLDREGRVLVEFHGVTVHRVGRGNDTADDRQNGDWLYQVHWHEHALPAVTSNGQPSQAGPDHPWIILSDGHGVGAALARQLRSKGHRCIVVSPGKDFGPAVDRNGDVDSYRMHPLNDFGELLERTLEGELRCAGVIHLWSTNIASEGVQEHSGDSSIGLSCGSTLQVIQQLAGRAFSAPPALWLVTRGAVDAGQTESISVPQAALWGLGRVAAMEHPELGCRLVDLDPEGSDSELAEQLAAEIKLNSEEQQIAYRQGQRFVARLEHTTARGQQDAEESQQNGMRVPHGSPFRLHLGAPGSFDSLRFEAHTPATPEPDQVEIAVRATGLNFSDILKAMGLYPGITDAVVPLGIECSGIVTSIGDNVERFRVGDEVLGVAPYSFASHARTAEYALVKKPDNISFAAAATIPITFLTAHYALLRLAQLQPGERLLIHAGAGGVGLAAIQIAQHVGAEIFATAGSDEKRAYLASLGVKHVMNSRSLEFSDQILEITEREGIDVVLNSLPGEAITRSLSLLRAYGRFLEIGKTDIYQNRMIGLLPFQDNLSYFAIDLDRMLRQRPDYIRELFRDVMALFEAGIYQPLVSTSFPAAETISAFRYMAQRKNIGKVVVELPSGPLDDEPAEPRAEHGGIRPDATYLITGGLGALGLQLAHWLTTKGARHLVLLSRRQPDRESLEAINQLRATGTKVTTLQADVAHGETIRAALAQIPTSFPPLRGVFHAAGVLQDGILLKMSQSQLKRAMAPKLQGGWNLHCATIDAPLDYFVLFSSVACLIGSPGQGNYAAGNASLDALAAYRRRQGLPALSVNWGPWSDSGMAAQTARGEQIQSRGIRPLSPADCLETLGQLLDGEHHHVAVMDVQWSDLLRAMAGRTPSLLSQYESDHQDVQESPADEEVDQPFRHRLLAATLDERGTLLETYFANELARIMELEASQLDAEQQLSELGLDSLMAMELKNNLERRLDFTLPMAAFMDGPSIQSLAGHAAQAVGGDITPAATEQREPPLPLTEWSPLVPLQPGGEQQPFFFVHPIGGDVRCYLDLAKELGEDRAIYALRPRGIEGLLPPHSSLNELLTDYAAAIQEVQARGPYLIGGWSTGGIYAFEVARRLHQLGEPIGLLTLFDSPLPSIVDHVDLNDDVQFLYDYLSFANQALGAEMDVTDELLNSMSSEAAFAHVLTEAKKHKIIPNDIPDEYMRQFVDVCKANVRILAECQLQPFEQPVHMFRPEKTELLERATGKTLTYDLGWTNVVGDQLHLEQVAGDHFNMMVGTNATQLGKSMKDLVDQACAGHTVRS